MKKRSALARSSIASAGNGKVSEPNSGSGRVGMICFLLIYLGQLPAYLAGAKSTH